MIPVNIPLVGERELQYLAECIKTGWVSSEGPFVTRFEEAVASGVGRSHGIAVTSGTAALDVAVAALGIGPGDEVIMPTFTIISCAAAVARMGAKPVLVDAERDTWNMDVTKIEALITSRTKAIMVVHIYGLPVDMKPVLALAERHGLKVIEDAAEVHGQTCHGRPCGGLGDISTLSFYPNKQITTGEGGMVLTDDDRLVERCRSLRNLCFNEQQRFVHHELGWNYRITNLQAAVGLAQMERLPTTIDRKRQVGRRYHSGLENLPGLQLPVPATTAAENLYWVFGVVLEDDFPFAADEAMSRLRAKGIGTRPFFWPMHEQPVFRERGWFADDRHPVAENLARRGFYLPGGLALSDEQVDTVICSVREVLQS